METIQPSLNILKTVRRFRTRVEVYLSVLYLLRVFCKLAPDRCWKIYQWNLSLKFRVFDLSSFSLYLSGNIGTY